MKSRWQRGEQYFQTIRHLSPHQWYSRFRWVLYRRAYPRLNGEVLYRRAALRLANHDAAPPSPFAPGYAARLRAWPGRAALLEEAEAFRGLTFTFLNETHTVRLGECWSDPAYSQLWRYQLHYFEHGVHLGAAFTVTGDSRYYETFKALVSDWIQSNRIGCGDGWHPYTVSLRLVHWVMAYELFKGALGADGEFRRAFREGMAVHHLYLLRHLEYDVGGNHLLENLRALVWGEAFFGEALPQGQREKQNARLKEQLEIQVLADGAHYELTPMYHCIVLWDFLELYALGRNVGRWMPPELGAGIRRMVRWLDRALHPDGGIPFFNDAVFGEAPAPDTLERLAHKLGLSRKGAPPEAETLKSLLLADVPARDAAAWNVVPDETSLAALERPASGYFTLGRKGAAGGWMVLDAGLPCPPSLPAHAHCDLLSFELSVGRERFLVNTGVYGYAKGAWRDFCRGSLAHNTLSIGGADQSEVWDSFRVGRRASEIHARTADGDGYRAVIAGFEGFYALGAGYRHQRVFSLWGDRVWAILDRVDGPASGEGIEIASALHWHPEVRFAQNGDAYRGSRGGHDLLCVPFGWAGAEVVEGREEPPQGWYCPEFGVRLPAPALILSAHSPLPFTAGCLLIPAPEGQEVTVHSPQDGRWEVKWGDGSAARIDLGKLAAGFEGGGAA